MVLFSEADDSNGTSSNNDFKTSAVNGMVLSVSLASLYASWSELFAGVLMTSSRSVCERGMRISCFNAYQNSRKRWKAALRKERGGDWLISMIRCNTRIPSRSSGATVLTTQFINCSWSTDSLSQCCLTFSSSCFSNASSRGNRHFDLEIEPTFLPTPSKIESSLVLAA